MTGPASSSAVVSEAPRETTDLATPRRESSEYTALMRQVRAAGLLDRRLGSYTIRAAVTLGLYAVLCVAVVRVGNSWYQLLLAVALGVVFGQVAFLGHDAGHQAIFAGRARNDAVGRVLGNVLLGLSYGWWVDKHNRHHANPNNEARDPDMQNGLLAFTPAHASAPRAWLRSFVARRQAWLFFPLLTLEGIGLNVDSLRSLSGGAQRSSRGGSRRSEAIGLAAHAVAFLALAFLSMSPEKALAFTLVNRAVWGVYMGSTFAPNHKGMPIIREDERLDFLRRQVLTSRNIRGGMVTDLVLGGLNYQIEHHLFPNLPRASLRRAQPLVRAYCTEIGVPYCETSLIGSYRAALGHLDAVGAPLRAARP